MAGAVLHRQTGPVLWPSLAWPRSSSMAICRKSTSMRPSRSRSRQRSGGELGRRGSLAVGAGLGGLSAALRLAGAGRSVTVLEREDVPGGRAGLLTDGGYSFDTGPTVLTMPDRFERVGDPHAAMDDVVGSLDPLLEIAARDEAAGLGDAPWPPHFRKTGGEAPRVAPSRAKKPLLVIANSPDRDAALEGLERWKQRHQKAASHLRPEDVLVDSMRGRSSTWTRIRVNLQHVPNELRPPQEPPDPDDDPTREWRDATRKRR